MKFMLLGQSGPENNFTIAVETQRQLAIICMEMAKLCQLIREYWYVEYFTMGQQQP